MDTKKTKYIELINDNKILIIKDNTKNNGVICLHVIGMLFV